MRINVYDLKTCNNSVGFSTVGVLVVEGGGVEETIEQNIYELKCAKSKEIAKRVQGGSKFEVRAVLSDSDISSMEQQLNATLDGMKLLNRKLTYCTDAIQSDNSVIKEVHRFEKVQNIPDVPVNLSAEEAFYLQMIFGSTSQSIFIIGDYKDDDFTSVSNKSYAVNSSNKAINNILPVSPTLNDEIYVFDAQDTFSINNCTINGNGKNIDGSATKVLSSSQIIKFTYNGTQWISEVLNN